MAAVSNGSTGWNGGFNIRGKSAKDRLRVYVANRRDTRWYNRRTGKAKRYSRPGTRDLAF